MKGIINKGIQDVVEAKFGAEAWEEIKSLAGCEEPFFAISSDYPDEMTVALINATAETSGLSMETVMVEYGKYIVPNTLKENYAAFFQLAGSTAREFLLNMSLVHDNVTTSIANARPPRFEYEEPPDGRIIMHYHSERSLCAVLRGLILGVGEHFGQDLRVRETACKQNGDSHCIMEVTFP